VKPLLPFLDQLDSVGGDGFAAADAIDAFIRSSLEADGFGREFGGAGEGGAHFGDAGGNLWFFGDQRGVDIDGRPAVRSQRGNYLLEQNERVGVFVSRIGVGKKVTNVGKSGGTEQCVTNCVGQSIGVGVAFEAVVGIEGHATEHERTTADNAVDVVAVADADLEGQSENGK